MVEETTNNNEVHAETKLAIPPYADPESWYLQCIHLRTVDLSDKKVSLGTI